MTEQKLRLEQDRDDLNAASSSDLAGPIRQDEAPPIRDAEWEMRKALERLGKEDRAGFGSQALLRPSNPQTRRRFVRDGEVAVTVLRHGAVLSAVASGANAPQRRAANAALSEETAKRTRLQQSLDEARHTIRDLQTKLNHLQVAHEEAVSALAKEQRKAPRLDHANEWQQRLARSERALQAAQQQLSRERHACQAAEARADDLERLIDALSREATASPEDEPGITAAEPVKWWLNSKPRRR